VGASSAHGIYEGLDLELLNPADVDDLTFLIEAQHPELEGALRHDEEMTAGGQRSVPGCTSRCTSWSPASCWPATHPKPGRLSSGWQAWDMTGTTSCT